MDREHRHGRIEGIVVERQRLGRADQSRNGARRSLRPHRRRRFDRQHVAIGWFVGARSGADIQNGFRRAERFVHELGDIWIGTAKAGVVLAMPVVIERGQIGHLWFSTKRRSDMADILPAGRAPCSRFGRGLGRPIDSAERGMPFARHGSHRYD